jgi:hypothetical protein
MKDARNLDKVWDCVWEKKLRQLWRLLGWFLVVDTVITVFGVSMTPLLLCAAADTFVVLLIIRSCMENRAATLIPALRSANGDS